MIELTSQQKEAIRLLKKWKKHENNQIFELAGSPGTGKTTTIEVMIEELNIPKEDVLFMAFVGKAVLQMIRNGVDAKTIHSTIYNLVEVPKLDESGNPITDNGRTVKTMKFLKKPELPDNIKLLVVDEGSMINKQIGEDILSFGLPVLVIGDIDQLPPIFGDPFFLNSPDIVLTEIMRQKLGDPIINLMLKAKAGHKIDKGSYGKLCHVIDKDMITDKMLLSSDATICGKNITRDNINNYVRESLLNIKDPMPKVGEKMICRQNNWNECLFDTVYLINGLVGYVDNIDLSSYNRKSIKIDFRPEFLENDKFEDVKLDCKYLLTPATERAGKRSFYNKLEYAYAITCHLSQGSQYDKVLIYNEVMGDRRFYNKWLYTAISRARKALIIAK